MHRSLPVIEAIEPRLLLASNVSIEFVSLPAGDRLFLHGDAGDNAIHISLNEEGRIVLVGLGETRFNGSVDRTFVDGGNLRQIEIDLGDGDNEVVFEGLHVVGDIGYTGGAGRDRVFFRDSSARSLTYNGGVGRDWLGIYDASLGTFHGSGGGHYDVLEVRRATIDGHLTWSDRSGSGGIHIEATTVAGATEIANRDAEGGAFPTWVRLQDNHFGGTVALATGSGNDSLVFGGNSFGIRPLLHDLSEG